MSQKHTMKAVVKRTGLKPYLIRMWERRYQAVVPGRTSTGRRVYSEDDVRRLTLLKLATMAGETIGQIAGLSEQELIQLVREPGFAPEAETGVVSSETAEDYLKRSLGATRDLDANLLESTLLAASSALGKQTFLQDVLTPLLDAIGEEWFKGNLRVAHEHLLSAVVRSLLGSMIISEQPDDRSPVALFTTPIGQHHELGALMASVMAGSVGWKAVYLGPDIPAEEIASAASEKNAKVVGLSVVYPIDDPRLNMELKKLARLIENRATIIVGGRGVVNLRSTLKEIGAVAVKDLSEFKSGLYALRNGD